MKGNLTFKTGEVPFRLTSSPTNKLTPFPVTAGEETYSATGILQVTQATIQSTRNAKVVRTSVSRNTTVVNPIAPTVQHEGHGHGGDPGKSG